MSTYHSLNRLLAELYHDRAGSRRIAEAARLDIGLIEFKDDAIANWHNILGEAKKRLKVSELVELVISEYREREDELRVALQDSTTLAPSRLEPSIQRLTSYVSTFSQSQQANISSIRPSIPPAAVSQSFQPPTRKFVEVSQEFMKIGRDKHWDRDEAASDFLLMLTQQKTGNEKKDKQHVLVLQGKEAGLDSLVERFEEMCEKATTRQPVLHAKINLRSYSDYYNLSLDIVERLARRANQKSLPEEEALLHEAYGYITDTLSKAPLPTPDGFAKTLTEKYLATACSKCTVVLLLQNFDMLAKRDESKPGSTSDWLRRTWLRHAMYLNGLVILITGETGLDDLEGEEFVSHHNLPPLHVEKLREWANQSQEYGFDWFADYEAQMAHTICNGNPEKFKKLLEYTGRVLSVGAIKPEPTE